MSKKVLTSDACFVKGKAGSEVLTTGAIYLTKEWLQEVEKFSKQKLY